VELLRALPAFGVRRVSLNFAVFRSAIERGGQLGAGPVARLWRRLLLLGSRWWQIEQMYRFNAKFGPEWRPRYLCYPGSRELARVAFAALRAEQFLVLPRASRARAPRPALAPGRPVTPAVARRSG
jgi:lysyl-tRNA synthetase class 2